MTSSTSTDGSKKATRSDGDERRAGAGAEGDERPAAAAPSAELLEFLGEFEGAGGEWIDPLDFERATDASEPRDGDADD